MGKVLILFVLYVIYKDIKEVRVTIKNNRPVGARRLLKKLTDQLTAFTVTS